jgi:hypothetical protein
LKQGEKSYSISISKPAAQVIQLWRERKKEKKGQNLEKRTMR